MYHSRKTNSYANARPAGVSDDDSDSDGDGFSFSGGCGSTSKPRSTPVLTNGGSASTTNGHPGAMGDGRNDEDWETSSPSGGGHDWGQSPAEAVRWACVRGDLEKLKGLLSKDYTAGINKFLLGSGENPLIIASSRGHSEIVEFLLGEKKANPDLRHHIQKTTALMAMVGSYREDGDEDAVLRGVSVLVTAGANLNLQDCHGMSALMIAVKRRRTPIVQYLLEKGADPNLIDPDGDTALIIAAKDGEGRLCRLLLEYEADVHLVDRYGFSAADLAQDKNHFELANLLYITKDSKWRPGLNPNLMQEIDDQASQRNKPDAYGVKEDMCIDLLLNSVDGAKFVANFRKHKISYVQFLRLDEDQLKEIGVDEVGVREGILEKIKQIQTAEWRSSSIKMVATNKNVTAGEAVCMIANINDHLKKHLSPSLKYLHGRISQKPLALRHDIERNTLIDMMAFCKEMEEHSCEVRNDAVELYKLIGSLRGFTELQIAGMLPKRTFNDYKNESSPSSFNNIIVGISVSAGVGLLVYGTFKGYWSWRK